MKSLTPATAPRLHLLLSATLIAATAVFGTSTLGGPGLAAAAPEWDIGIYDQCVGQADNDFINGKISKAVYDERVRKCCADSGGILKPGAPAGSQCVAPPKNPVNAPGRVVPTGIPVQTFTPDPATAPAGSVTQTFTPTP